MENKRSFTVEKIETSNGKSKGASNLGGRFISSTPAGAAKKVGSKVCRESDVKGRCVLYITIRETTRESNHKDYVYKITRILDPVTIVRDGVEITYRYRTEAKRILE
jgi:hypothetical protein